MKAKVSRALLSQKSGATVPVPLMESLTGEGKGKMGIREQTVVYGMTETSPVSFGCGKCAEIVQYTFLMFVS
jgi:hypothetical protein